ncbi:MAG: MFS transporter, partial [Mycobacterium sp.]|nr:MFS transporter [Mycobacterium sp.]
SARAMGSVNDPAERGAASAAINTVQLISAAIAAGLAGVVVNAAKGGDGVAAHLLFTVFTALSAAGVAVSYGATRSSLRELESV